MSNLADYGNPSAASIPLVLDERVRDGTIKSGDVVSMWAFMLWGFCTQLSIFLFSGFVVMTCTLFELCAVQDPDGWYTAAAP